MKDHSKNLHIAMKLYKCHIVKFSCHTNAYKLVKWQMCVGSLKTSSTVRQLTTNIRLTLLPWASAAKKKVGARSNLFPH